MAVVKVGLALVLVGFASFAGARGDDPYAYLTGVYWFDGEFYQTDVTCWNIPGDGYVGQIKMSPGGTDGDAPEGWLAGVAEWGIFWYTTEGEYRIPPGEWLSGFLFTTEYDPGEVVFGYTIYGSGGSAGGEFTPEPLPEPWLAGPAVLAVVATWETLRRRRQ